MAVNLLFEKDTKVDFYGLCTMIFAYRTYVRPIIDRANPDKEILYSMSKAEFMETVKKLPKVF